MTFHQLKCSRRFFERLWSADKDFELRKDDRGYRVGDVLFICETNIGEPDGDPGSNIWTGRWVAATISGIIRAEADRPARTPLEIGEPQLFHESLAPGYVALMLDDVRTAVTAGGITGRWAACGDEGWIPSDRVDS